MSSSSCSRSRPGTACIASRPWTCSGATGSRPQPPTTCTRRSMPRGARSTPQAIEVRDEVLRLEAEVDVDELELAAVQARRSRTATAYRAALALYTGELLPENRYDDWAEDRRDELGALAAELADKLDALGGGDDPVVRAAGRRELLCRPRARALGAEGPATAHPPPHARRHGRRGKDASRARARACSGRLVPRWRRARRARGSDRLRRRPPGSCGFARRAGALGPGGRRWVDRLPGAAITAAAPRQLRAPPRGGGGPGRQAPSRRTGAHDPRHEP